MLKLKRITSLIFPSLAVVSILVSISTTVISLTRIKELAEYQDEQEAGVKVLGKITTQSEEERQEFLKQRNDDLKNRSLEFSPDRSQSVFFQERRIRNTDANSGTDYTTEVAVVLQKGETTEEIFKSDFRLSNLEWLNDRELVVYRSCGTECMTATIIDIKTKLRQDLSLGVGYTWSPNKQYVAVHHYSYKYGISVANRGDEYGRRLLEIRRDHPEAGSGLTDQTTVAWSPDSSKLAIAIRKTNEEKLELLVYEIGLQFKLLSQQNLEQTNITGLAWEGENTILVTGGGVNSSIFLRP